MIPSRPIGAAPTRRRFVQGLAAGAAGLLLPSARLVRAQPAPAAVAPDRARPSFPSGVQSGDVSADGRGVLWCRADRPSRVRVEWDTTDRFANPTRLRGPAAMEDSNFTAKLELANLPPGQKVFYRVTLQDLSDLKTESLPVVGSFRTPPAAKADVTFAWSGDVCGQGFGINPDFGGLKVFEAMRRHEPHFFVHSGDHVYADNPLAERFTLDDGSVWRNLVTPAKAKVAETLDEFRGNFAYNLLDEHVRRFNADVPVFAQWDDHETMNNWFPQKVLAAAGADARYAVKSAALLSARAARAFREYLPVRHNPAEPDRVYRSFSWGPSLDLFILDQRSYRGPNSKNDQSEQSDETAFHGRLQLDWLKAALRASKATWKVICSDMPIGLVVGDGRDRYEAVSDGKADVPRGRELEIAELLQFMKANKVRNTVWLTADVHYAAAHHYDPGRARFGEFDPFWEFVAGPLHAGGFGPGALDGTFGPRVMFQSAKPGAKPSHGLPPASGHQHYGVVRVDGASEALTVALHNLAGEKLYEVELPPARG